MLDNNSGKGAAIIFFLLTVIAVTGFLYLIGFFDAAGRVFEPHSPHKNH